MLCEACWRLASWSVALFLTQWMLGTCNIACTICQQGANMCLGAQLNMVLEPGGLGNQMVTGISSGELKFVDFRVVDSSGQMGVWKTVEAHTKGAMTAMAAHPYAPLLATATATQVQTYCDISDLWKLKQLDPLLNLSTKRTIPVQLASVIYMSHGEFKSFPDTCQSCFVTCTGFEAVEPAWRDARCYSCNSSLLSTASWTCQLPCLSSI